MNMPANMKPSDTATGSGKDKVGAVMVCGAGVAGIQASLDLSAAGFRVYLVEEKAAVGGGMSKLDKTFPTGDCATCIISPKLVEAMRDLNIDVYTMSNVTKLEGEPGNFKATILQKPRYIDIDKCTACGDCTDVCPVEIKSQFDANIGTRKATDRVYAQAAPNANVITKNGRATCSTNCPIDHSVQGYVNLIGAGKVKEAAQLIWKENPLPAICGRVCFHPCEGGCNRGKIDSPVNIRDLKRYAIEKFPTPEIPKDIEASGKTVAVIGSGPAGLAAAHALAQLGHKTTVFESLPVLGGMLTVGIPDYRLPPDIFKRDIEHIGKLGVEFKTETTVGKDLPAGKVEDDFDAVFIATGAHISKKLDIPGEDCEGVVHGVDFLREFSLTGNANIGKNVVIIGGGNTAVDTARTAMRVGAEKVTVVYRRTREEMPAEEAEIDAMLREGVEIKYLAAPSKILSEGGKMTGVACVEMKLGEPDESGRRRPVKIDGSEFTIKADMLIPAVSQSADKKLAEAFTLETTRWDTVQTDELTLAASRDGFFAGGDVVLGPSSVIEAIAQGKRAAQAIDNFLNDRPVADGIKPPPERENPVCEADLKELKRVTAKVPRVTAKEEDAKARVKDFREVESVFTDEEAQAEASRCLACAGCCECMQCVEACQAGAINHNDCAKEVTLDVGAVLLTPGFEAFDATQRGEFGFGYAPNVVSNVQFERILSASGPTAGHIVRPSDGKTPKRLAFIQCVGSRDQGCGNEYCSSVCCMAATKEAILAKEHEPDLDITVFYLDLRAYGKDFDRYCNRAINEMGVRYVRSFISRTFEMPDTRNLGLVYMNEKMERIEEEFDMVVLSLGLEPSKGLQQQAEGIGIELNEWGFAKTETLLPVDASRPGVFVGGAFQEPKDIPDTVMQSTGAAARAMALLADARGTMTRTKDYPPQRDVTDEPARIGAFICHCGSNIASVVDVEAVVEYARTLPNVVFADHTVYTCADDSQALMKELIAEHRLNRVIVASCTPRTHEPIFRDTLRDAGLNPYLLEMANIRDQCSWVHAGDPDAATEKAKDLVTMAVGRAAALQPLKDETVPVKNAALVVGGGIAGMTSALALSDQGFPVHLVEQSDKLGGTVAQLNKTYQGDDLQAFLSETIEKVNASEKITVYTNTTAKKVNGHIGEFSSTLMTGDEATEIEHGVVVVATGATEHKPSSYCYGESDAVLTQLELTEKLRDDQLELGENATVAMIQCVEQRTDERPYCSRVCCTTAVKNAMLIKDKYPKARVMVFYRDMRTYGFRESAYRQAREKGILFFRYTPEEPPVVTNNGKLTLKGKDLSLGRTLEINPDLLVLAAPMEPRADREVISELLRVPLNADGFFLEAHVKLRPVDFASEGLFLCGTTHAPKFVSEVVSQANAVAGRAASILSKKRMPVSGQIAWVDHDKCISCMTCVHVCPYNAPMNSRDNKAEIQTAVCMGCGSCASECPAKAITLRNFMDTQVIGALDSLLGNVKTTAYVPAYPEQVGIATPKWKTTSKAE